MVRSGERLARLPRFYHREARRVQKHKRTQDPRDGPGAGLEFVCVFGPDAHDPQEEGDDGHEKTKE